MVYEGGYAHPSGSYYERQAPGGVEKSSSSHPSQSGAPGGPGGAAYYTPYPGSSYPSDHQLTSSRATLMNDFLTAQQMPRRKVPCCSHLSFLPRNHKEGDSSDVHFLPVPGRRPIESPKVVL